MRRWLLLLGGPLIWAIHFAGVYGIASVADVITRADDPRSRAGVLAFTLACAAADALLIWLIWRRKGPLMRAEGDPGLSRFWRSAAAGGAVLSLVFVLWQGLPAIIGH